MKLKRLGTLLLTAIIAATTLAGCGAMPSTGNGNETGENASVIAATEEDTDGQITLRVVDWSDGSATQREEFHKKFEEAHPDIKIEYTMLTVDQFKNTIVTMIKSGEGPDLFPIPVGLTLNTAVEEGWFQPINDYVTSSRSSVVPVFFLFYDKYCVKYRLILRNYSMMEYCIHSYNSFVPSMISGGSSARATSFNSSDSMSVLRRWA